MRYFSNVIRNPFVLTAIYGLNLVNLYEEGSRYFLGRPCTYSFGRYYLISLNAVFLSFFVLPMASSRWFSGTAQSTAKGLSPRTPTLEASVRTSRWQAGLLFCSYYIYISRSAFESQHWLWSWSLGGMTVEYPYLR